MDQEDRNIGRERAGQNGAGVRRPDSAEQTPVQPARPAYYPPPQGQAYYSPRQGQAYYPPPQQGQAYYPPRQGQTYYPPPQQGQGYYPPRQQSQTYYPPPQQGQAYYPPRQGQTYYPPPQQSQGYYPPPQGQGYYPPPQQGQTPPPRQQPPSPPRQTASAPRAPERPQRQEMEDRIFRAQQAQIHRAHREDDRFQEEPEDPPPDRGGRLGAPIIILIVLLVLGIGIAGWQLLSIVLSYERDRTAYADLAGQAVQVLAEPETPAADDAPEPEDGEEEPERVVSELPISVDWDYLRRINGDIIGWLYCPGTVINYPVVQTTDNSYYLKHGFDGQSNAAGTLFADTSSTVGVQLANLIVYGHNMKDGSMFHSLMGYINENYFRDYPSLYFLTPEANYRVDLICAHIVESSLSNFPTYFSTEADYQTYLNTITSRSFWVNYGAISTDYQLMTFSTCSYTAGYSDPRLLVHGLMIPVQ